MMNYTGKTAFLISKPLQLMIALCISQYNKWTTKPVFIILDFFDGAHNISRKLLNEFIALQSPIFCANQKNAFSYLREKKFDHLFIDSDIGVKNFLMLASLKAYNPKISINVYEEGLGTYRADLYSGIKKNILNSFGVGVYFGSSRFVSFVHIFNEKEYSINIPQNKYKVKKIDSNFSEFLAENHQTLKRVFGLIKITKNPSNTFLCSLYLSDWHLNENIISKLQNLNGDIFIKPHPHTKYENKHNNIQIINSSIPAELVIMDLLETYNIVHIYDHESSVRRYISDKRIIFKTIKQLTQTF